MPIAIVTEPGACVGEMSLLLGVPATADVVASEPSVVAVIEDAHAMLDDASRRLPLALARLLAERLQVMTTYLVDIKQQYADHEGGLGMVDVVLGSLMRSAGHPQRARVGTRSRSRVLDPLRRADRSSTPSSHDHRASRASRCRARCGSGPGRSAGPALKTRVEPIRSIQDAVGHERRLVHVAAQHDGGLVLLDPRDELLVAVVPLAGPARRRRVGWRVVHPDPSSVADERRVVGELAVDDVAGERAVPPRAHRHQLAFVAEAASRRRTRPEPRAASSHRAARSPSSLLRVEVVVARARDDGRLRRDAREVLEHDRDLRVGLDDRRDVEVVAGEDDEVVVARDGRRPSRAASSV